ncbi:retron Ec48 family effector membrane protein [Cronobacter sakazakii]|uniref:retron Ec48 family effector membrane protein n=1 Tax=Cronobacter TaxID=413496 RepID=UPI000A19A47B|nr:MULTISPECIES: retron Ec48 family effector membrane protein [Cronobacter]EGZ6858175.1 hypothetical protein [Cronobacter sakazakii]EGZ6869741.1 hypothetical protein [Cronobacter sakazakii]EIZ2213206.1 retron Ec48 family effector membrane protein [Cronobacter sakazakii]EIZ2217700.1 retron Ec48 family effector membrane protein [Cronobacter sakazakii]EIZ2222175.1 retron Ec48 family effector membrane protein [Cronobacter sakazakii]
MSKDNGMKYFIFFIAIISFVFIFVLFFSLTSTIISQDMYKLDLCIQSKCIDHFSEKIKGVIALAQAFGWFIALVATIGGVIVALRTYRSGIDNSNITNHIAHFSMFRDFVNTEIAKRKKIYPDTIDVYAWYNVIFPRSKKGDLNYSAEYLTFLNGIKSVIEEANYNISSLNGNYKYQTHQRKIIDATSKIGMKINNGPKNLFVEIECEVLSLIDSVNRTFIDGYPVLCMLERKYI